MAFGRVGALGSGFGRVGAGPIGPIVVGGVAPVLSAASAVDFADVFVLGQATTDVASGTLYAVVVASAASTPTAAQIVAGTDAAGAAAPNGSVAVASTGVKQVLVQGLTAVTAYKVCMTHRRSAGVNSNVVTGTFTTDTLVLALVTNGTATGLTASTGCGTFGTSIADPFGGTNAIRWVDNNDAVAATQVVLQAVTTFFNGVNKFHFYVKYQSGAAWVRINNTNITVTGILCHWNSSTGALGTTNALWTPSPVIFDVNGWKLFSGQINLAGADVAGTQTLQKGATDNSLVAGTRDGTHIQDLYNLRVTRV